MNAFLRHRGIQVITIGWVGFITENVVLSHNRDWIIQKYGDKNYHYLYNTLSTVSCATIGLGFLRYRGSGPKLWNANKGLMRITSFMFLAASNFSVSQFLPPLQIPVAFGRAINDSAPVENADAQTSDSRSSSLGSPSDDDAGATRTPTVRCPIDFKSPGVPEGGGMQRITRHPMLWTLGGLGISSALSSSLACHVVAVGFFPIFAVIGTNHQDYRHRRGSGGTLTLEKESATSNVPFLALLQGRQSVETLKSEIKWNNAVISFLLSFLITIRRIRRGA